MDCGAGAGDRARRSGHHQDHPEGRDSGIRVDCGVIMQPRGKIVVASQHYPPDPSTTAAIMAEIACRIAGDHEVVVLSGSSGALPASQTGPGKPRIVAVKNRMAGKAALVRRRASELLFAARTFLALTGELRRGYVVLPFTAPSRLLTRSRRRRG